MNTTIIELEFFHLPYLPPEVQQLSGEVFQDLKGYLLQMRDGDLVHAAFACGSFVATESRTPLPHDDILSWAPLDRRVLCSCCFPASGPPAAPHEPY